MIITGIALTQGETRIIKSENYPSTSTGNTFGLWHVQAPEGFLVSVLFEEVQTPTHWDNHSFLYYGDDEPGFSEKSAPCDSWSSLINHNGSFRDIYGNFISRGPSVIIVFFRKNAGSKFLIKLRASFADGK